MQHTDMYNLNQPEMDDTFSTQPLNDNARSTESTTYLGEIAAKAEIAARQALEGRVAALEVQKIFFGEVVADGNNATIDLGVTPKAVLFMDRQYGGHNALAVGEKFACSDREAKGPLVEIVENGFFVHAAPSIYFFYSGKRYNYVAFA